MCIWGDVCVIFVGGDVYEDINVIGDICGILYVSFVKEPYRRDGILQKRAILGLGGAS